MPRDAAGHQFATTGSWFAGIDTDQDTIKGNSVK
jgi:hypothetical protein